MAWRILTDDCALTMTQVETIGDAYMAVANLVKPQEKDHAARIVRFALDAVEAANAVPIKVRNKSLSRPRHRSIPSRHRSMPEHHAWSVCILRVLGMCGLHQTFHGNG